jgi:cobalt-zinc-cadmium efflux system protein
MTAHSHDHGDHQHHQGSLITHMSRSLIAGIGLNLLFVAIETVSGILIHSLALLSDAGHNLSDVAGMAISLLAFRLSKVKSNENFTYGYQKTTVLAALLNVVILLVAVGGIGFAAFNRLLHPQPVRGNLVALVAAAGILINGGTALLLLKDSHRELNIKGAYLHMVSDAVVSLGVVIAGLLMQYTGWYGLDTVVSIILIVLILISTWRMITDSLRLSLDGVPRNINIQKVEDAARKVEGVRDIHHVHIWAMSTTQNALTAHVVIDPGADLQLAANIRSKLKHAMEHLNIHHSTFEMEAGAADCRSKNC